MSSNLLPEPERWSERVGGTSAEDAIGASLKRVRTATEPSSVASLRWARQAMSPAPGATATRLWSTAIAAAMLGAGGVVAAQVAWHAAVRRAPAPESKQTPAPRAHHAVTNPEVLPTPVETPPVEAPFVEEAAVEAPAATGPAAPAPAPAAPVLTAPKRAHARAATPAPAAPPNPVVEPAKAAAGSSDEAQLVAQAFVQLRTENDARAALALLDEYDQKFGAGAFATEAALARAEALLALGRTDEALPILLAIDDPRAGLTPEVRIARAELLVQSRRCGKAAADFDELLAPGAPAAVRERALYARASCHLRGSRPAAAIPDLESYLAEYPEGRFASTVEAALAKLRRP